MKVTISTEGCIKNNISPGEVLMLLSFYNKVDQEETKKLLISKGFITEEYDNFYQPIGLRVTRMGKEMLDSVVVDSSTDEKTEVRLAELAGKLKEIFPQGKKDGTSNYWAEGKALITKRLKAFFKKYGDNYTDEQIITATKKYVESFNGDYQFMRTLKYFIFKDRDVAGEREYTSDLLNYIENAGQEDNLSNDWNIELI